MVMVQLMPVHRGVQVRHSPWPHGATQYWRSGEMSVIASALPGDRPVAMTIVVGAGSALAHEPKPGAAHYLEHVIAMQGGGSLARRLLSLGGAFRALTSHTYTAFSYECAGDEWDVALPVLLDGVVAPVFSEADVDNQRQNILTEIATVEGDPEELVQTELYNLMFNHHPMRFEVLGNSRAVSTMRGTDLRRFHSATYTPRNMVLTVVGAVDPQRVQNAVASMRKDSVRIRPTRSGATSSGRPEMGATGPHRRERLVSLYVPHLCVGFRDPRVPVRGTDLALRDVTAEIVLGAVFDEDVVQALRNEGAVEGRLHREHYGHETFAVFLVRLETRRPERAEELLAAAVERVIRCGLSTQQIDDQRAVGIRKLWEGMLDPLAVGLGLGQLELLGLTVQQLHATWERVTAWQVNERLHECFTEANKCVAVVR